MPLFFLLKTNKPKPRPRIHPLVSGTLLLVAGFLWAARASAQCTPASINWDWQYKVTAFTSPAKFGLGVNAMTMTWGAGVTPAAPPVNTTFTGYGAGGYGAGSLAQFSVRNGTITLTFDAEVQNVKFAVYDLDNNQVVNVTAADGALTPAAKNVTLATSNASNRVTITGNNTASATATGRAANLAEGVTTSGVNIDIAGPVKTITLTFSKSSAGPDPVWLSDIAACVTGDYLTGYLSAATPETGQPGFIIASEANNVYAVNTSTAVATRLFTDAALTAINSLAYDPYSQVFYYTNGDGIATNKAVYQYDVKTCTRSTFIADVTAPPYNISLNTQGVGGGGASFYNGSLFLGIDAGVTTTEDNAIWRIDRNAAGQAISAARVFSVQANNGNTSLYNWGDFVIYDRILYNFNSATAPAANTEIIHYNLNTQSRTAGYTNTVAAQVAAGYDGTVYNVNDGIAVYNKTGAIAAKKVITGGGWPTGATALDGAEYFKFPADFGDAPASYGRPFHRFTPCSGAAAAGMLQLGATLDYEVEPAAGLLASGDNGGNYAGSGTTNDEDGVGLFPALALSGTGTTAAYPVAVAVRNTSGATQTLHGWIDFDGDGKFSAGEYASAAVVNNATTATITWPGRVAGAAKAGTTYARFRLTSTTLGDNAATTAEDERALAAASDGEVEDHVLTITLSLSGTVFRDANGLTDNQVNGTGLGSAAGSPLYAYLVNGTTVVDKAAVNSSGAYTLSQANANTAYTVLVSAASVAVGAAAPGLTLPSGWVAVGEAVSTTPDASPDSQLIFTTGTGSAGGLNFGLEQRPDSNTSGSSIMMPLAGTLVTLTNDKDLEPLSGTDPEDGPLGAGSRLVITSLAGMEGNELYYNNVLLAANSVVDNYNPNLLALKVKNMQSTGMAFNFTFRDAAGQESAAPAVYAITWATSLPLTLVSFDLKKTDRHASLHWVTVLEENTQSFMIEHSLDGENWRVIGSQAAAGTRAEKQYYSFTDMNPGKGTHLYRLKMLDQDGSFTYGPVKALQLTETNEVSFYPNPVSDKLFIAAKTWADLQQVTLVDTRGSVVFTARTLPAGGIDMQPLPAGIYLLQVSARYASLKTYKIVKR